jgi:hypothetical protein
MTAGLDVEGLRARVRADRHATSYPLIVVGAVTFHYVSVDFGAQVSWVYGIPLAFVILWALQRRTEQTRGVGSGNDDVLLIGFGVFMACSFVTSSTGTAALAIIDPVGPGIARAVPAALGIGALGLRQANRTLLTWSLIMLVGIAVAGFVNDNSFNVFESHFSTTFIVLQGVSLAAVVAGLVHLRTETVPALDGR